MLIFTRKPDSIKVKVWITLPHSCLKGVFQCKSMDRSVNYFLPWWSLKREYFPHLFDTQCCHFKKTPKAKKLPQTHGFWYIFATYKEKRLFVVDFFIYLSKYRVPPPFREKKASAMCLALFLLWHLIAGSPLFQVTHHVLKVQMLHWMYNIIRWIPTTNFWYSIPSRVLVWYHGDK